MRVAAIQMNSGSNVRANLELAGKLLAEAAADGCRLAVLPENFALMPEHGKDKAQYAESPGDGPIQDFLADVATEHDLWIIAGSMPLVSPGANEQRVYGGRPVVAADGQQQATYQVLEFVNVVRPRVVA